MTHFDEAFKKVILLEGGYSNDPRDSGGATKWGVTEGVARSNGYKGKMTDLTQVQAAKIYKSQYWDTLRLDTVSLISPKIAEELFDTSVNMGTGIAGRFLQRALNVFNMNGSIHPDMVVDGVVGPMSVAALKAFIAKRGVKGESVLIKALNAQQGVRYMEIAENSQKNEAFEFGWFDNRVS